MGGSPKRKIHKRIPFILGGVGTGGVGLADTGALCDKALYTLLGRQAESSFSHFALKAVRDGKVLDARILHGDFSQVPAYENQACGYGPGHALAGMPHFKKVKFKSGISHAGLAFRDKSFPGTVRMRASNPLIPLNDRDSGIPAAFFELEVENSTDAVTDYVFSLSFTNPFSGSFNKFLGNEGYPAMFLSCANLIPTDSGYGDITLMCDCSDVSVQEYWHRGSAYDKCMMYWAEFISSKAAPDRQYVSPGTGDTASLQAHITVPAGQRGRVRYVITWNIPNVDMDMKGGAGHAQNDCVRQTNKVHYTRFWRNSVVSAKHVMAEWDRLFCEADRFEQAFKKSSLPDPVADAVYSGICALKSFDMLRLANGSICRLQNMRDQAGNLQPTAVGALLCSDAMSFLFPTTERGTQDIIYKQNNEKGLECRDWARCFEGIYRVYRAWKISGDSDWLRCIWPGVKQSLAHAWAAENHEGDSQRTGVFCGGTHPVTGTRLFGESPQTVGFYLLALSCAAQISRFLDQPDDALFYERMFESGSEFAGRNLFNGQYYIQRVDLSDRSSSYASSQTDEKACGGYWDSATGTLNYQIAEGCAIDQVLPQWYAEVAGAGDLLDQKQVKYALGAIYKNNFRKSMRALANPFGGCALNGDAGSVLCAWPKDVCRPALALPYADVCLAGYEYQAAAHMIHQGLVKEGLKLSEAVYKRPRRYGAGGRFGIEAIQAFDSRTSVSGYLLLGAVCGFEFDMPRRHMGFSPRINAQQFASPWALQPAWGEFFADESSLMLTVHSGELTLDTFRSSLLSAGCTGVFLNDERVDFELGKEGMVTFSHAVMLRLGQSLMFFK